MHVFFHAQAAAASVAEANQAAAYKTASLAAADVVQIASTVAEAAASTAVETEQAAIVVAAAAKADANTTAAAAEAAAASAAKQGTQVPFFRLSLSLSRLLPFFPHQITKKKKKPSFQSTPAISSSLFFCLSHRRKTKQQRSRMKSKEYGW